jgi:hypothetical protein
MAKPVHAEEHERLMQLIARVVRQSKLIDTVVLMGAAEDDIAGVYTLPGEQ